MAKKYGYTDEEIDDFVNLQKESGIKYDDFVLGKKMLIKEDIS